MTYEHFAEYISSIITPDQTKRILKEFQKEEYAQTPDQIIVKLDKEFMDAWENNAPTKPRMGNSETQKKNFKQFLDSQILNEKKLKYKVYGREVDFTPYFSKYREITRGKTVSSRVEKTLNQTKGFKIKLGEERPLEDKKTFRDLGKIAPTAFYKKIERQIDNSSKANHPDNLITIRNAMRDLAVKDRKSKPLDGLRALELYEKANKALEPYYSKSSMIGLKTDDELKQSLRLEGYDISNFKTSDDLKSAAKSAGISLRRYDLNKNELVDQLKRMGNYDETDLKSKSVNELKWLHRSLRKEFQEPKRSFYIMSKDLPSSESKIEKLFADRNKSITPQEVIQVRESVSSLFPFLSPKEREKEVNRRLAAKALDVPVFDREIEKRYMNWKYKEPERNPTFKDLISLSNVTNKEFRLFLSEELKEREDPFTGKPKLIRSGNFLPEEGFRSYKKYLKEEVKRGKDIVDKRAEDQTDSFIEKAESFALEEAQK